MKAYIKSLFMVMLLIVATLPLHSIGVAAKESDDDDYEDDDRYDDLYDQPETKEAKYIDDSDYRKSEPSTFWLTVGESKLVETNVILTYLGSSSRTEKIVEPKGTQLFIEDVLTEGAEKTYTLFGKEYTVEAMIIEDTKPMTATFKINGEVTKQLSIGSNAYVLKDGAIFGVQDIALSTNNEETVQFSLMKVQETRVCEQFQMTYKYLAPSQGVVGVMPTVETTGVKNVDVYPVQPDTPTFPANEDDLGEIADAIEPTSVTKEIVGESTYKKEILDEDAVVAQLAPVNPAQRDALAKRISQLAYVIGGEEYMSFSFREDKVAEAIVQILQRKGVIISEKNGDWVKQAEEFIRQNNIDVEQFVNNLRLAQKYLSLAQIQTYNAVLYLEANNLAGAETEIKQAEENFAMFKQPMNYIAGEINRWKPFQGQGQGKAIKEDSKTFCLVQGEVGYPVMLYQKKDDAVLVGYNVWDGNSKDKSFSDDKKSVDDTTVRTKAKLSDSDGCKVEGNGIVPVGTRVNIDGASQYCDPLTKKMLDQKVDGEVAENNYECFSNEARNGVCENSLSFLQKIWKSIVGIFGF